MPSASSCPRLTTEDCFSMSSASPAGDTVGLPASVTLTPDSAGHYLLLTYNSPHGLVSGWIDHGKLRFLPARHPDSRLPITAW
jgi:hypothetical protein